MFKKLQCLMFGHKYECIQVFDGSNSARVRCIRCNKTFAVDTDMRIVLDWDIDFENIYRILGYTIINPEFTDGSPLDHLCKCSKESEQ